VNATVLLTAVDIDIPGYQIIRPIGEGGMASVFLALQKSLDRQVALKVMSPILAANADFASRFLIEGKITAKLQHPNLVTIYDIGTHKGVYYLAAEYIGGGTLKERLAEGGLSVAEILDIVTDVAHGLDFAHQKGFVHRDVKPANVLFREDGRVVLADFGIAKAMDGSNSSTVAGASVGTPDYMSPEQARGEPVDGRSDLYSLGTMLYEMLAGRPPYQAGDPFTVALMHVTHPVPELPENQWLQPLIAGLMAKQAAERFNTGAATIEAMQKLVASAPPDANLHESSARKTAPRLSGSAATQQRTRVSLSKQDEKKSWVLPAAGAGLLVLGIGGWLLWPKAPAPAPASDNAVAGQQQPSASFDNNPPATDAGGQAPSTGFTGGAAPMNAEELQTALDVADKYLATGTSDADPGRHLLDPEDDSANYWYQRVLAADPQNVRAQKGIRALLAFYRKNAREACVKGQFVGCGVLARAGLRIDQGDPTLLALDVAAGQGDRGETPKIPALPAE
jgi:serine/threonine-protein kinase PpkA